MDIHDITLKKISNWCPEQYYAFLEENKVGYLRLKYGEFTVDFPDACKKEIIFLEPEFKGDGNSFDDENQRLFYLTEAKKAILNELLINEKNTI